ncbi:MAG: hypothetical protein GSR72_02920 [Desulfurococcales archaeon]|nr:hypothetical protein [Desulfurococcales archaeon]
MKLSPAKAFIARYGERGYLVLKAILEARAHAWTGTELGDFSYRHVKEAIEKYGLSYNPSPLLRKLEKEYGLIETTYRSSTQHWWRIVDPKEIERTVKEYEGKEDEPDGYEEDYRARMLRIQFLSLDPERILETLQNLSRRKRLSSYEKKLLRQIVFEDLPHIVSFLEQASAEYSSELSREIAMAEAIISAAESLVAGRKPSGAIHLKRNNITTRLLD